MRADEKYLSDIHNIADHYGIDGQISVTQEECAELIQAISKFRRYPNNKDILKSLVEEIADVRIMIAQIEYLLSNYGVNDIDIDTQIEHKIYRQLQRILKESDKIG